MAHAMGRDRNCRVKLIGKDDINGLIVHPGAASGSDTRRQRCFLGVKTKVLSSVRKHTVIVAHLAFIRQPNRLLIYMMANSSPLFAELDESSTMERCRLSLYWSPSPFLTRVGYYPSTQECDVSDVLILRMPWRAEQVPPDPRRHSLHPGVSSQAVLKGSTFRFSRPGRVATDVVTQRRSLSSEAGDAL